jgi:dihydroorotate dehydrogenase (fumarate)
MTIDLSTTYLGLPLAHPLVASASPLSQTLDGIRSLEDGGAAAIVMFSLFEEQIRRENDALDHLTEIGTESFAESLSYFPDVGEYEVGPDAYLDLIRRACEATDVPIIASLNGTTLVGWTDYALQMQQAGAQAIELNLYHIPADLKVTSDEVEQRCVDIVESVTGTVTIPVAVKLSPYFSAMGQMAERIVRAGTRGLVLFNRFYQPDFDLETMQVTPSLELSSPAEIRLPLLWIAILHGRIDASLAASTGVESEREVVKYLLAGADAVMTTSALLRHGASHCRTLTAGLRDWLEQHDYESVRQMRGSMSQRHVSDPTAFERANYIRTLQSYRHPYLR